MNAYNVYEYMKQQYITQKETPDINEVTREFIHVPWSQISEGIAEFREWKKRNENKGWLA